MFTKLPKKDRVNFTGNFLPAIIFFVVGGISSVIFYHKLNFTFFYQSFSPESILWACGHSFLAPKDTLSILFPFFSGQVTDFDCSKLPNNLATFNTSGKFSASQLYLTWLINLLWRFLGVSYHSLSPLIFILWGAYVSGTFLLFKEFLNKFESTFAALFICISPVMVQMIPSLRDFSKAPFIIWAILFLIRSIKQKNSTKKQIYLSLILAGAVAGIGMGFRADLYFLLPIGTIFLYIGATNNKNLGSQFLYKSKLAFVFIFSFIIFSFPILNSLGSFGGGGMLIMQGMSEPFRADLKLTPAGYSNGWAYSDELTLSSIAASERLKEPGWDQKELEGIPGITVSQSILMGTRNFFNWANFFAGDIFNQSLKSVAWIIGFPAYIANSNSFFDNSLLKNTPQWYIYKLYQNLASPIILVLLLPGFLLILFKSFLTSKSQCYAITFLFVFLCAYPAIQFNIRHFFYLEFIWILCLFSLIKLPQQIRFHFLELLRFICCCLALFGFGFIIYLGILRYQEREISRGINKIMSSPRQLVPYKTNNENKDYVSLFVAIPNEHSLIVDSKYDSMTPEIAFKGIEWDVRAGVSRYFLTISGAECNTQDIPVTIAYSHTPAVWQPLDKTFLLLKNLSGTDTGLIFPGFYRPSQHFNEIRIPKKYSDCNVKLEKVLDDQILPNTFVATISGNELIGPYYKGLGHFSK